MRSLFILIIAFASLSLVGCSQNANDPSESPSNLTAGSQLPGIFELDDLGQPKTPSAIGDGSQSVLGSDFLLQLNGTVDGTALVLDSGADDHEIAWGLYRFTGLGGKDAHSLNVEALPHDLHEGYFIGIANYTQGNWDWFGPNHTPEFQIDLSESHDRYITALGNMYFVVVTHHGNIATHSQSTLLFKDDHGDQSPGIPHDLHASDGEYSDHVHLSWEHGAGATSYEVYRRLHDEHSEFELLATTEATEYDDYDVSTGAVYIYKVRSVNDHGHSDFSNSDSGYSAEGHHADACPSELNASDGEHANAIVLSWHGIEHTVYLVFRRSDPAHDFEQIAEVEGLTYNDLTAEQGVTYEYKIGFINADGSICYSNSDHGYLHHQ